MKKPSSQPVRLTETNLSELPQAVIRPQFDRQSLTPGIVHIGLGNFHRAHQAWYLQQLMQLGEALDWAIVGAGVMDADEEKRQKLAEQDNLTTLVELDPERTQVEIVGSMIDFVPVVRGNKALVDRLSQPDIRIVSLTITEGGYFQDPLSGNFTTEHADILHDAENIDSPRTVFGVIVSALKQRRESGAGPFTGLSCDNLQGNGDHFAEAVLGLAKQHDPELASWIEQNCTFPNTMVDCIVPATTQSELDLVRSLGIDDSVPVTHENFREWVIEDSFCVGRPAWEKVGAKLVENVTHHEQMKIRVLNGGHQVIAGTGELLSIETISGTMAHPKIAAFLNKIVADEIAPHVVPVPGTSVAEYLNQVVARFSNQRIVDTTRRVSSKGTAYHPAFVFPSILDGLSKNAPIEGLALVEAVWARMAEGTREDGSAIEPKDANWEQLQQVAIQAKTDPSAWLNMREIYGAIADDPRFVEAFLGWLRMIWAEGIEKAIDCYLGS